MNALTSPREPLELWTRATTLKFFGGEKPLHVSTLYRGIDTGRYPPPVFVSANSARWLGHECREALQRMAAERDTSKPQKALTRPWRRGKSRKVQPEAGA